MTEHVRTMPRFGMGAAFTELVLGDPNPDPAADLVIAGKSITYGRGIQDPTLLRMQLAHLEILDPDAWRIDRIMVGIKLIHLPPFAAPHRTRTIAFAWQPIDLWCHQTVEIQATPQRDGLRFHARFVGSFVETDHL